MQFTVETSGIVLSGQVHGVVAGLSKPTTFELHQNFPNPFNPTTAIQFDLPATGFVTLKVYTMLGQEAFTLIDNHQYEAGVNKVSFDASGLTSGVYFYRLTVQSIGDDGEFSGNFTQMRKMILLK